MLSSALDPRFKVTKSVAGAAVFTLASIPSAAAPKAAAGAGKASGAAAGKATAAPEGGKKGKAAKGGDAPPAAPVLGEDGKPLSKKDLRILERQRKEVFAGFGGGHLDAGRACCVCL